MLLVIVYITYKYENKKVIEKKKKKKTKQKTILLQNTQNLLDSEKHKKSKIHMWPFFKKHKTKLQK